MRFATSLSVFLAAFGLCAVPLQARESGLQQGQLMVSFAEGSVLLDHEEREMGEYRVALGQQIKDGDRGIVLSRSKVVAGRITRVLYMPPKGFGTRSLFEHYLELLEDSGFETLFTCAQEECGNQFHRAAFPDVMREMKSTSKGYHMEKLYLSARMPRQTGDVYIALYTFVHQVRHRRVKGKTLVQLDVIEERPMEVGRLTRTSRGGPSR